MSGPAGTHRVFVYGTLRTGGSAGQRMAGGTLLGGGFIRGRLYQIDWYPGVVLDESGGPVTGEVFEVDDDQLAELDLYEGAEYRRTMVRVDGDVPPDAWIWEWMGPLDESKRIAGGDWLTFMGADEAGSR